MNETKITGVDAIAILVKWRKFFVTNFLLFSVVAAIISLVLPKWYTSTATLMPPEQQSMTGLDLGALLGDLPFNIPSLPGMAGPSDLYVAILKSRNVREAVINDLDLKRIFEQSTMEDALRKLDGVTRIDKTEENIIVVRCTARSRKLAADMARAFVQHLDRVNKSTRSTSARYTREFIEKRLTESESDLKNAAEAMRDFQRSNKVIALEEQTKAAITSAAQLEAEVALSEINYNIARRNMDASHPELQNLAIKINELKRQLEKIETGARLDTTSFLVPFEKIPDFGLKYAFLLKDVEVQKAIYKLLMQQYEQAKIQEAKDTPTIQILDQPVEPEKRSKPKRAIIVIASALMSVFVSFFIIFVLEYLQQIRRTDPVSHEKLEQAWSTIKQDLPFFRKKSR